MPELTEKNKRNFLKKVSTTPTETGCLEWTAYRDKDGYGKFGFNRNHFRSTRIAYFLATGVDPGDLCVCHRCDNPPCINPEHLFLGTYERNTQDMLRKGRANKPCGERHRSRTSPETLPRGEAHGMAKLTATDIPIIRDDTRRQKDIAADYGVSQAIIGLIKQRKRWKHVA